MHPLKALGLLTIALFGGILFIALIRSFTTEAEVFEGETVEIVLEAEQLAVEPEKVEKVVASPPPPQVDRIEQLFAISGEQLPIVKTIAYKRRVSWLRGRPAWLVDYAKHYGTSRYFIARSLSGHKDYFFERYANGDRFNILDPEKDISFHLLVDHSTHTLWFYYLDGEERVLLKTYTVGLGQPSHSPSGSLTPLGTYSLGQRVAIYRPGNMGYFNNEKTEMIRVFGTRWIPFSEEVSGCTAPAKGLGIHGTPWAQGSDKATLLDDSSSLGKNESDGCIRLATEDIEELFSIIITKPTTIELVRTFSDAKLPGKEASR